MDSSDPGADSVYCVGVSDSGSTSDPSISGSGCTNDPVGSVSGPGYYSGYPSVYAGESSAGSGECCSNSTAGTGSKSGDSSTGVPVYRGNSSGCPCSYTGDPVSPGGVPGSYSSGASPVCAVESKSDGSMSPGDGSGGPGV